MSCMFHRFDATTHRCARCSRWQAGYAPKKVSKTPRAECQVCEREQALKGGTLVHHGYTRPGCGFIVGDCFGVNHKPFPAYDALVMWHDAVADLIARTEAHLAYIPVAVELPYTVTDYDAPRDPYTGKRPTKTVTIKLGDAADYTPHASRPSFRDLQDMLVRSTRRELEQQREELHRVAARIVRALEAA